nr:tRNA (N(6)-L-threonylcarbamoyladenosine(37)-C(2))-methylthiotransferase MtaB [uncultured Alistipes sp.]
MSSAKKVGFYTLGCKLNFSETSTIAREFEAGGFVRARQGETADVYVVNSCSVTEHADKKCRNIVRRIVRTNPDAIVAVTGCYAQLRPQDLAAIDGVDLVIGNNDKGSIYERVSALGAKRKASVHTCEAGELTNFFAAFSTGDRTRSFLKVQDGCNYHCSYCTIPLARGASRNLPIADLAAEAQRIAAQGQREIVLTGINTGDFGRTTGEPFIDLLRALDRVEGIDRYRISSIEPNLLTDEVIAFTAASKRFQPHFHIPIQSGSDRILALMRRRYNTAQFADRIAAVRRAVPDVFLGIDVIVGFPGETDEDFADTYRFLERLAPAFLHIFPYSARPDTPAAGFPNQVPPPVVERRAAELGALSERLHRTFYEKQVGTQARVLWESTRRNGYMYGYTGNYVKVRTPFDRALINTITPVKLTATDGEEVMDAAILSRE